MTTNTQQHAANYPPSAAARWLSCSASVDVVKLYNNDESDAALKGTKAHLLLENGLFFGAKPSSDDIDMNDQIADCLDHIKRTKEQYGSNCKVYAEQKYDIPETGEFGTCDITYVNGSIIHIADYKHGYVEVGINGNAQLMLYLCGAIAKFGKRSKYIIEVLQPNYDHIDGIYRQWEVSNSFLEWFQEKVYRAVHNRKEFYAGEHCKKSYCPHRGSCATFNFWAKTHTADAYFPSDVNALSDDELSLALDHAEILYGLRDELRKEAMRRILNMDKNIDGYKVAKGRKDRKIKEHIDEKLVIDKILEHGAKEEDLYEPKQLTSIAGFERFFKKKYEYLGRGKWRTIWDAEMSQFINEFSGGLTLVRASDGRPSHTRGSEFGTLTTAQQGENVKLVI